jgi:hypothetical protein
LCGRRYASLGLAEPSDGLSILRRRLAEWGVKADHVRST